MSKNQFRAPKLALDLRTGTVHKVLSQDPEKPQTIIVLKDNEPTELKMPFIEAETREELIRTMSWVYMNNLRELYAQKGKLERLEADLEQAKQNEQLQETFR